jgi:hypothetical protein
VAEFFIIGERFVVITRQLQAAEVRSKLSTMNDKSSFANIPLVIIKQLVISKQLISYTLKILQEYQLSSLTQETLYFSVSHFHLIFSTYNFENFNLLTESFETIAF